MKVATQWTANTLCPSIRGSMSGGYNLRPSTRTYPMLEACKGDRREPRCRNLATR